MENQDHIQFKQKRELSEIITVTFQFIRENYKSLFSYILKIVGPFFILMMAAVGYYTYSIAGNPFEAISQESGNFIIAFIVLAGSLLLFYAALYGTIFHYIKSYIKNKGVVTGGEIKAGVQRDFFKFVLLSIISAILIIAGTMLLIIPGIYVMVPLSLASAVLVFQRYSVTEAIAYAFDLIKNQWWITFITLIVIWLLVYIIGLVFQIPLIIYTIMQTFTMVQENSLANPNADTDWIFIALNVLSSVVQYLLSSISIIALAFVYFNLNEHKNLTGTYETIENLGN